MNDETMSIVIERIVDAISRRRVGEVLAEVRYGAALYYLLAKKSVAGLARTPNLSSEILATVEYWFQPLQGIYDIFLLGEIPAPSSRDVDRTLNLFRKQWAQPNWSEAMILEGIINSLTRSIVVLKGLIELFQRTSPQNSYPEFTILIRETEELEQLQQLTIQFIESLPSREW